MSLLGNDPKQRGSRTGRQAPAGGSESSGSLLSDVYSPAGRAALRWVDRTIPGTAVSADAAPGPPWVPGDLGPRPGSAGDRGQVTSLLGASVSPPVRRRQCCWPPARSASRSTEEKRWSRASSCEETGKDQSCLTSHVDFQSMGNPHLRSVALWSPFVGPRPPAERLMNALQPSRTAVALLAQAPALRSQGSRFNPTPPQQRCVTHPATRVPKGCSPAGGSGGPPVKMRNGPSAVGYTPSTVGP